MKETSEGGRHICVNYLENRAALYPLPTALLGRFAPCVAPWGRGLSA